MTVLRIDRIAYRGAGVARAPDGAVCFVPGTCPGELVEFKRRHARMGECRGLFAGKRGDAGCLADADDLFGRVDHEIAAFHHAHKGTRGIISEAREAPQTLH